MNKINRSSKSSFAQMLRTALAAILLLNLPNIVAAQIGCVLVCDYKITIEVPTGGNLEFLPEYMLEGNINQQCPNGDFRAQVMFGSNFLPATGNFVFDSSHVGQSFIGRIKDLNSGNACWGEVDVIGSGPIFSDTDSPERSVGSLTIYPNPASRSVLLSVGPEPGSLILRITDMQGRVVLAQNQPNGGPLDVSGLAEGTYVIWATTAAGEVFSGKFQKQN